MNFLKSYLQPSRIRIMRHPVYSIRAVHLPKCYYRYTFYITIIVEPSKPIYRMELITLTYETIYSLNHHRTKFRRLVASNVIIKVYSEYNKLNTNLLLQ